MIITIDDVRRHHCSRGAKRWFDTQGLSFRDFLAHGIDAETLIATGDAQALATVEAKRKEIEHGR